MAGQRHAGVSSVASGRAESAAKEAKTTTFRGEWELLRSPQFRAQGPRVVLGLPVFDRTASGSPVEVAGQSSMRVYAGVSGLEGGSKHHQRRRDRHAGGAVRDAGRASVYSASDNGPEFIASAIRDWLAQVDVQTLYVEPGSPVGERLCGEFATAAFATSSWRWRSSRATCGAARELTAAWKEDYQPPPTAWVVGLPDPRRVRRRGHCVPAGLPPTRINIQPAGTQPADLWTVTPTHTFITPGTENQHRSACRHV